MKFSRLFVLFFALMVLTLFAVAANPQGKALTCEQVLVGQRYAYVFQGYVDLGAPIGLTPNAGGGYIRFHADGTFNAWSSLSIGGLIFPNPMHGTYQMESYASEGTCGGTATTDDGTKFQLLVTHDGKQLEQMHTDFGLVVVVGSEKMEKGHCSKATLNGNYVYIAN